MPGTELECVMATIMGLFHKYAGEQGDKNKLNRNEFKTLINKQLPGMMKNIHDPAGLDKIMKSLDHDQDDEVDFAEFVTMVATITLCCQEAYVSSLHSKK
uniref:protein S100-A1-like n=1 Tax=Pristiophorus japonicus TaxID=55135 RepID=UPI00398F4206